MGRCRRFQRSSGKNGILFQFIIIILNYGIVVLIRATLAEQSHAAVGTLPNPIHSHFESLTELSRDLRIALAGGIAGGVGTALLYPIDTAKTLRQTAPAKYPKTVDALLDLCVSFPTTAALRSKDGLNALLDKNSPVVIHIGKAYRGVASASLGSVPSSALYFGAYEIAKKRIGNAFLFWAQQKNEKKRNGDSSTQSPLISTSQLSTKSRMCIHSLAAATGNAVSSIIFVPKEYIKQQLQASKREMSRAPVQLTAAQRTAYGIKTTSFVSQGTAVASAPFETQSLIEATSCTTAGCVINETIQQSGIRGLYRGYQATLLRNIPTAVLRFALYEEIKLRLVRGQLQNEHAIVRDQGGFSPVFFLSGAVAGAAASGLMTPFDVLKTRVATKSIPSHLGALGGMQCIVQQGGLRSLYAGAQARMFWSGAFSAIGFGTFEAAKSALGVGLRSNSAKIDDTEEPQRKKSRKSK